MKSCAKCNETKDDSEYYARDKTCKDCRKERVRLNRFEKIDYYREYDKKRFQEDPRVKERHKRYQKTDACKESMAKSRKKWLENNQHKRHAHNKVNNAVRDGVLIKPNNCESCGSSGRIEGHHEDYDKPLEVMWLCRNCHAKQHY